MGTDMYRKAVTIVNRGISSTAQRPGRIASWIRKDYPQYAPRRGHCYLLALLGTEQAAR